MFRRRLLLLVLAAAAVVLLLITRMGYLTMVQAEALRARAEKALRDQASIPTARGRILDRHGRV